MRRLRVTTIFWSLAIAALIGAACSDTDSEVGAEVEAAAGHVAGATASTVGASSDSTTLGIGPLTDDGTAGIELAATPEFCAAAETLIGAMETIGHADLDSPAEVRLAYTGTLDGLAAVEELAPNAGVAGQIREANSLFLPLADLLAAGDWDISAIGPDEARELAILSESTGPALSALTDDFERYVGFECGIDIMQARADGVDRFRYDLSDTAPLPVDPIGPGTIDAAADLAMVEGAPLGERGGATFCAADRLLVDAVAEIDNAGPDDRFVDALLASADVYTTWGELLPATLAVRTVEMTVLYAELIATYGETVDANQARVAYQEWRSSPELLAGRSETNEWISVNC